MRLNTTKQKLADGATVTGVIINENAPASIELLARIGCFDFVMIDCEHGPMSLFDVENLVRACEVFGLTPLARVPDHAASTILRFLDRGVQGVIVPHVNTVEQALAVARAAATTRTATARSAARAPTITTWASPGPNQPGSSTTTSWSSPCASMSTQ